MINIDCSMITLAHFQPIVATELDKHLSGIGGLLRLMLIQTSGGANGWQLLTVIATSGKKRLHA